MINILKKDAVLNDLEKINKLIRISKGYWGYDENFLDKFMQNCEMTEESFNESLIVKLFYDENNLAGLYNFIINEEGLLELDNFFVHPRYIGQGVGRILWDDACKMSVEKLSSNEFIIWSDPNAEEFYVKMGCTKIGVRESVVLSNRYSSVFKYTIK